MDFYKSLEKYSEKYCNYLKGKSNVPKELFYLTHKFLQKNKKLNKTKI